MPISNPRTPISPRGADGTGADHTGPDRTGGNRRDALQALLTRLVDAREGLDTMIDRAEREAEPILRKIREDHHEATVKVSAMLAAEGGEPETDASMMSTVNKAVVSIRALFDEIDGDALEPVVDGEQNVLDAYDDAIATYGYGHERDELIRMRERLAGLLDEASRIAR